MYMQLINVAEMGSLRETASKMRWTLDPRGPDGFTHEVRAYVHSLVLSFSDENVLWAKGLTTDLGGWKAQVTSGRCFETTFYCRLSGITEISKRTRTCLDFLKNDEDVNETLLAIVERFAKKTNVTHEHLATSHDDMLYHCYYGGLPGHGARRS